jgi:hypothetical protein
VVIEFTSVLDTFHGDERGGAVTFVDRPGRYFVPARPADLVPTLRAAFKAGRRVRVTYDTQTLEIADALLA